MVLGFPSPATCHHGPKFSLAYESMCLNCQSTRDVDQYSGGKNAYVSWHSVPASTQRPLAYSASKETNQARPENGSARLKRHHSVAYDVHSEYLMCK